MYTKHFVQNLKKTYKECLNLSCVSFLGPIFRIFDNCGGSTFHIFQFTDHESNRFKKKLILQNMNIWIWPPLPPVIEFSAPKDNAIHWTANFSIVINMLKKLWNCKKLNLIFTNFNLNQNDQRAFLGSLKNLDPILFLLFVPFIDVSPDRLISQSLNYITSFCTVFLDTRKSVWGFKYIRELSYDTTE